ncbi:MAG: hypothetical protein ACI87E_001533 [Mariniblastus sp.]
MLTLIINGQVSIVKPLSSFGFLHLTMLAKPVCDRAVYKLIRKHKFRSFVEIGMSNGTRCLNMLQVAKKYGVSPKVRYTGVDEFDARGPERTPLALIEMHRVLKATDAKTQLVPGDVRSAIGRIANSHVRTDLVLISAGFEPAMLEESWFYFPRMLHSGSLVLLQPTEGQEFQVLNRLEVEKLADQRAPKRIAA